MKKIIKNKLFIFLVLFCFQLIFLIANFKIFVNPKLFASKNKIKSSICSKYIFSGFDPYTFIKDIDFETLKIQNNFIEKFIKKNSLKLSEEYKGLRDKLIEIKTLNLRILNSEISKRDIDLFFLYNFGDKIMRLKYKSFNLILNSFLIYFIFFFYLLFSQNKNSDSTKNNKINQLTLQFNSFENNLKTNIENINNKISDTNTYLNKLIEDKKTYSKKSELIEDKNRDDIKIEDKLNSENESEKGTDKEFENNEKDDFYVK